MEMRQASSALVPARIANLRVGFDLSSAEERLRSLDAAVLPGRAAPIRSLVGAEGLPTSAILPVVRGRVATVGASHERAVRRFEQACRAGVSSRALDRATLLSAHRRIVPGGGTLRHQAVRVGAHRTTGAAIFLPPPPGLVSDLVDDLLAFLAREDVSGLTQACVGFAQLGHVHPFADGNGRLGRWLIQVVPRRRGTVRGLMPPLGVVFASRPGAFLAAHAAFRGGDVDAWCAFVASCVDDAVAAALQYLGR
jgi:Fic/DOC family